MGVKGSPTCVMNYDGAVGYLIGEPNQGLAAMFTMMNYERLSVGIQGLGTADAAYQAASDMQPNDCRAARRSARSNAKRPPIRSSCTRTCDACC